jgi:drug/metabolite transporter (DMT)-like permease
VFLTLCHMLACSMLSYAVSLMGLVPRQSVKSRRQLVKISVLALVFCFTVVGGNISLRFLPVSFNQAVGATTPFFTALFSAAILGATHCTAASARRDAPLRLHVLADASLAREGLG